MEISATPRQDGGQPLSVHTKPPAEPTWTPWKLLVAIVGVLILVQIFELPKIADWSLFAFYDPGTAFKGDVLISAGLKPGIDFGYTHGLASLIFAHWALKFFGRDRKSVV